MGMIRGVGVSAGIAIGVIHVPDTAGHAVERRSPDDPQSEVERFRSARDAAVAQLKQLRDRTAAEFGEGKAELFDTHRLMLQDPDYVESIEDLITSSKVNAEFAVNSTAEQFAAMFAAMDNSYMQARAADVKDVSRRVINVLEGRRGGTAADTGGDSRIILAEDLAPSETVQLDRSKVLGFVTARGSANSHTAILARTMGLPAIIGIGDAFDPADDGRTAVIDGTSGLVFVDPDEKTLAEYQGRKAQFEEHLRLLQELKGKPTETKSGQQVRLYANIGRPSDVAAVLANDAEGIGLFRSEFLYLESEDWPTEEFQFEAYREVAQKMGDRLVVIRTLDIGADKQVGYFNLEHEDNPALGYRAIRICLTRPEIFKVQLRALLRASAYGNIAIMLPMITSVQEVRDAKKILDEVKDELRGGHVDFDERIQVGIMIETPASVIMADELAAEVDFFSIGTNDLTQYTLACDRQNPNLARFADPHSPAVLRMIRMAVEAAHRHNIWCGICGELGADLSLTDTFLRLGLDELSVPPASVLPLRNAIRNH
ncbi:phosphoenolpyruvate--protein phosphotransferase [Bifidobacterium sp. SMB2]|uniref:Phosphoenolpyruvate-protein phosphotransferase n=1 Tax=Bifidobacterium saimiriisciurei TaxID=2661627 RepID=A0ABX0CAB5_9BIFI|nr:MULTISPECIES: phosphoenolpyruvate--protein phosphotransferase [Bifidobacterium]NEG95857.1 phosphoenolpyruvate--protein phosphotransferase [Bifidobacterium sp. SMB2]NEH12074.1 phosphoenolpyruvate--protein phosphotransferase [Bifidobacterium saimiriisciurei]